MHKRSHYIYPDKDSLVAAFVCEFERFLREHPEMGVTFLKELVRVLFVRSRALADRLTDVF